MKIGVFDSGRGGEFIARGLKNILPQHEYVVVNDHQNMPYGSRSYDEVTQLTLNAVRPLILQNCPIIIIACNTATVAAIRTLRASHPNIRFIGIEPMVKPAAHASHTKHITVLATPLTLASQRYQQLIKDYGTGLTIDQPIVDDWAFKIENHESNDISLNDVGRSVASGSDTIVLACTHYIELMPRIAEEFPGVAILEPTSAIAKQIVSLSETIA